MDKRNKIRYDAFIEHIRLLGDRGDIGYTEIHHIIPRCFNGHDDSDNLIVLTLKEHYLAHWLLWKTYPNSLPIARAFLYMNQANSQVGYKPFQGKIYSRGYAKLRQNVIDGMTGRVNVRDNDGNIINISSEEYANNKTTYKFHTTGMIWTYNIVEAKWMYITSELYQANKDIYKVRSSDENLPGAAQSKFDFIDQSNNEIIKLSKKEAREKNKVAGYKRFKQKILQRMKCYTLTGNEVTITCDEYYSGNYTHSGSGTVKVFDSEDGNHKSISQEEYYSSPRRYLTSTKGKVLIKDSKGNSRLIGKEEFDKEGLSGQTKGLTTVFDKNTNTYKQITTAEFNTNKQNYSGPCAGKINAINKITGVRCQIPKDKFDKSIYMGLGNKKFLFRCQNILTQRVKNVNIYEWALVKDNYIVLDQDKFNKAKELMCLEQMKK